MLLLFKKREREKEWERLNVRERTKHNKERWEIQSPQQKLGHISRVTRIQTMITYSNDDHVPIIQNAVKTPTPPHCASFIADAVVGTISTFAEDQCARGMNVFNISLICVKEWGERGKMWVLCVRWRFNVLYYFYYCFCLSSIGQSPGSSYNSSSSESYNVPPSYRQ